MCYNNYYLKYKYLLYLQNNTAYKQWRIYGGGGVWRIDLPIGLFFTSRFNNVVRI